MTPKGVEHFSEEASNDQRHCVKIPMTPKGVEHETEISESNASDLGEDSYDAERR